MAMPGTSESGAPARPRPRLGAAGPPDPVERLKKVIAEAATPEDALEPALGCLVEAVGGAGGAVCFFDQRKEVLRLAAECNLSDEGCRRLRNVRRGDVAGWDMPLHGLLNRRAYLIDSAAKNRYVPPLIEGKSPVRSIVCLPIYHGATALGSLLIVATGARVLMERDIRNLDASLRELSALIEAIRLRAPTLGPAARPFAAPPAPVAATPRADPTELVMLRERLEELETRVAAEHARAEELAAKLAEATAALTAARPHERDELRQRLAEVEARAAAQAERAAELEAQLTAPAHAADPAELGTLRGRVEELEAQLAAEHARAEELAAKLAEATATLAAGPRPQERDELRQRLAEIEAQAEAQARRAAELEARLEGSPAGDAADAALKAQVAEQQKRLEELEPAAHAAASLERDLRVTREREMALRASATALEAEVARLRAAAPGVTPQAPKPAPPAAAPASRPTPAAASRPPAPAAPAAAPAPAATATPASRKGGPSIVVVDTGGGWDRLGATQVMAPDEQLATRIEATSVDRLIVNLTAPGALHALARLRAAGSSLRFWACLALGDGARVLPLGMVEPIVLPVTADALADALAGYAVRGTRVVTLGRDVETFAGFRQSLARHGLSVSMAWDAKQATDLIGMVRPEVAIVDLESLREGCGLVTSMAGAEPLPHVLLLLGPKDPAQAFAQALRDPAHKSRSLPLDRLAAQIAKRADARPPAAH